MIYDIRQLVTATLPKYDCLLSLMLMSSYRKLDARSWTSAMERL